ncbi:MAG: PASTA domain-containing protein [Firmicutes bacterium]|nr:PASTA domain-containing protein [Bacillota bacterium]
MHCFKVGSSGSVSSSSKSLPSSPANDFVGSFEILPGTGHAPAILRPIDQTLENPKVWTRNLGKGRVQYTANGVPFLLIAHQVTWALTSSNQGETVWSYQIEPLEHIKTLSQTQFVIAAARLQGQIAMLAGEAAFHVYSPPTIPSNALQNVPPLYSTYVAIALINGSGNTMTVVEDANGAGAWYLNGQLIRTNAGEIPSVSFMDWVRQTLKDSPYLSSTLTFSSDPSSGVSSLASSSTSEKTFPNIEGLTTTQAQSLLHGVNAHIGTLTSVYSTEPINTIINQNPQPYASWAQGDSIMVTLSRGVSPSSVRLPKNTTATTWQIPNSAPAQSLLKIVVTDSVGNEEVFYQRVNPGQQVKIPFTWYGTSGQLVAFLNGQEESYQPLAANNSTPNSVVESASQ